MTQVKGRGRMSPATCDAPQPLSLFSLFSAAFSIGRDTTVTRCWPMRLTIAKMNRLYRSLPIFMTAVLHMDLLET